MYDKKPRFEIGDFDLEMKPIKSWTWSDKYGNYAKPGTTLGDVIEHKELFKNYPELKDVKIAFGPHLAYGGKRASYDPIRNEITIHSGGSIDKDSILHEIQHAIQEREGFARGGSPQDLRNSVYTELEERLAPLEKQLNENLKKLGAPYGEDELLNFQWYITDLDKTKLSPNKMAIRKEIDSLNYRRNLLKTTNVGQKSFEKYLSLAGEIESRDVAARMGLTETERARTMPYSSENILPEKAIVRFGRE